MIKLHLILLLASLTLFSSAEEPTSKPQTFEGWGTAVDPTGNCKIETKDGRLTIDVPVSKETRYDLAADFGGTNAPRVVAPVKGDFVVQVKIDISSAADSEKAGAQEAGYYSGAGIVAFADEENFVRLERAALFSPSVGARLYTNFELRVGGKVQQQGNTGDLPPDKDKPVWLRLERKGAKMHASMSQDGEQWKSLASKELGHEAWSKDNITAGVAAVSVGKQTPFAPTYSDFTVWPSVKDSSDLPGSK